ncbi:MAG TPA: DNA polymerase IV [Ilumatobacteraceae bacterium]|nr:DNA polymerase IV [Ilumatobacteraceae bacterium]
MRPTPSVLHADLDAFYASVEQLLDPTLRGRPIAVGGGVVLAASYEAKRYGVSGGMAGWKARQLCPGLVFVRGHFREYQRLADDVMAVFRDFTPLVQRISIDEAFLDVAGAVHLFGPPEVIARAIRQRVREDVGLPVSVGVARTKSLAKIASQAAKPDGLLVVHPDREREFLLPLPVEVLWGVGPATQRKFAELGIHTVAQLAESPFRAQALAPLSDDREVQSGAGRAGSVGAQSAFARCHPTDDLLASVLGHLADRVAGRLRAKQRAGRCVTVRIRFAGARSITRSRTFADPIAATLTLAEAATALVQQGLADHPQQREISLLAISVSHLIDQPAIQLDLLRPNTDSDRWALDHSVDAVRSKFGKGAVGYARVAFDRATSVPDEFRELAEHD